MKLLNLLILFISFNCFSQVLEHKVKNAETLFGIAKRYSISLNQLREANKAVLVNGLQVGQTLTIPESNTVVALDSIQSKVIAIELIDCEATKKELDLTTKILKKTEDNSGTQATLIGVLGSEREVVNKMAETNQALLSNCEEQKKELNTIIKKDSIKNSVNKVVYFILGGVLGTGTTYMLLK